MEKLVSFHSASLFPCSTTESHPDNDVLLNGGCPGGCLWTYRVDPLSIQSYVPRLCMEWQHVCRSVLACRELAVNEIQLLTSELLPLARSLQCYCCACVWSLDWTSARGMGLLDHCLQLRGHVPLWSNHLMQFTDS